jgi:hypothetical protein
MTSNSKIIIQAREYSTEFENLQVDSCKFKIINIHEDSTLEAYYAARSKIKAIDEFSAICHKIFVTNYSCQNCSKTEIKKMYAGDMYEDENFIFNPVSFQELKVFLSFYNEYLVGFFDPVLIRHYGEIMVYQGEYKGKPSGNYLFFNDIFYGYVDS